MQPASAPMKKNAANTSPPSPKDSERARKVAALKQAVREGTYSIDSRQLVYELIKPMSEWLE